jgi:hypothetical protein
MITIKTPDINETTYADLWEVAEELFNSGLYGYDYKTLGVEINKYIDEDESFYTFEFIDNDDKNNYECITLCKQELEQASSVDSMFNILINADIKETEIQAETYRDYYDMYGLSQSDFF